MKLPKRLKKLFKHVEKKKDVIVPELCEEEKYVLRGKGLFIGHAETPSGNKKYSTLSTSCKHDFQYLGKDQFKICTRCGEPYE